MALRTPLHDWHVAHGATLVEFAGWDMPIRYGAITDEHLAVRNDSGLFDVSHMGRLSFSGTDADALIQRTWTNNASTMKEMQVRYGLICNERGGILDDVLVYRWPYGWAMVVNASNRSKILDHLKAHNTAGVRIDDQTTATCMLAVQGPKSIERCQGMFEADISALKYYFAAPTRYRGHGCVVSRTGYTGEDGFEVMIASAHGVTLADDLVQRGAKPCGLGARDTLRLEAAMPLYGHELNEELDPLQAGLAWAVKLDKGDFVGREAIVTRQQDASRPVRVGLELEGRRAAREGAKLFADGQEVGKVTSGTITPTLNRAIGMAYVRPDLSAIGTTLSVEVGKTQIQGRVVELPFYRRPGK
jgi:aminomethyltransferase